MIYFINFDGLLCTVFDSQIFTPIKLLLEGGNEVELVNYNKNFNKDECRMKAQKIENILNCKVYNIKRVIGGFIILNQYIDSLEKLIVDNKTSKDKKIILHGRGPIASYIALRVKERLSHYNVKVVADFRGSIIDEYILSYEKKQFFSRKIVLPLIIKRFKDIERYVTRKSDFVFCVSNQFKEYLNSEYHVPRHEIMVVPTCIDINKFKFNANAREQLRKELNITNKYVVVYSGGGQDYQLPELLVNTFIKLKKSNKNAFFLILSKDKNVFIDYLKKYNVKEVDYLIISCDFTNICNYLSCGDLGLLLREENNINKVASPTKFAEYLICHLPVIISRGIGDTESIIKSSNIGMFLDDIEPVDKKLIQINRCYDDYESIVKEFYNWGTKVNEIGKVYANL